MNGSAEQFWEKLYAGREQATDRRVNIVLADVVTGLADVAAGDALDLGCAEGADSVWLATRGWNVVSVDISPTALRRAADRAAAAGVAGRIRTEQHDLAVSFPAGDFDLVTAQYLQTPLRFPREQVLAKAANAVRPGGLLLVVDHASVAPWSWNRDENPVFPTPQETMRSWQLEPEQWIPYRVEAAQREARGPAGETAIVTDNIIALRRS
ncbi:SAM-dependent methyltransferase [Actinoplanes lutulentus]|uniref:Methyltransferase family protein n=1 Tax=Actinoplanes lutulentus TaxID=1287878 RepID=A0A327YXS6_9ACTN|nr:class I SAM-dependent methyltransferase [Actinoplanes lutulentus]MBB2946413.1 SAM-dependent methyltransferase [Actinoplanes lutulentus]RAK25391.1 methyltransferase family protein [Actinoplanes lutulentus]